MGSIPFLVLPFMQNSSCGKNSWSNPVSINKVTLRVTSHQKSISRKNTTAISKFVKLFCKIMHEYIAKYSLRPTYVPRWHWTFLTVTLREYSHRAKAKAKKQNWFSLSLSLGMGIQIYKKSISFASMGPDVIKKYQRISNKQQKENFRFRLVWVGFYYYIPFFNKSGST